jgi:hypothetical protein
MRIEAFTDFIVARHNIYLLRRAGVAKPWTEDPILQSYRFCNVYRELDTETKWIADNWRPKYGDHPDYWFAMVVARFFNWHETLDELTPLPFKADPMYATLTKREARGQKVFTGAYVVSTNGMKMRKTPYVILHVLEPAWAERVTVRPREGDALESFATRLQKLNGFKGFMAGQIVADVKYSDESPLAQAADWDTWAVSGPGSRRGMNRLRGVDYNQSVTEHEWRRLMDQLRPQTNERLKKIARHMEPLHAQDLQNCLCEFDKYERVRLGQGKPRSNYPGAK